jgi:hypothetical protein
MATSERGTPAVGSRANQQGPTVPSDEDNDLEDIPTFLVTNFVDNVTCAAVDFLQYSAKAFEKSLNTALAGEYTASTLAKDSAALWARNVRFLSQVFSVGVPGTPDDRVDGRGPAGADCATPTPELVRR